jgi:hypothetical protein
MKDIVSKYGEWVYRGAMIAGMAAILWLNQNYVTRSEFNAKMAMLDNQNDADNKSNTSAHLAIQASVSDIATTMKLLAASQVRTEDHETRLRLVEAKQIDVISRLNIQERNADRMQQDINKRP